MLAAVDTVQWYEAQADMHERQNNAGRRDVYLVLAADAAWSLGQPEQAERLRRRLLRANPHHLLRPYTSFAEALEAPDVQMFLDDLRRQHPPHISADRPTYRVLEEEAPHDSRRPAPVTSTAPAIAKRRTIFGMVPGPSPYANEIPPPSLPAGLDEMLGRGLILFLLALVVLAAAGIVVYTFVRPLISVFI